MAIFHLTAKVISRGKGQSAIAAAAYRSGERLRDEQSGELKMYRTREERILFTDIMAPKDAPEWAHDRNALWNNAERAEKRKDAQLAREIEVSLPHELTDEQRLWLVKDFAREAFVRKGYAVDLAIHLPNKGSDQRNYHAHLLVTRRTLGPEGFAKTKEWQFDKTQLTRWREQWAHLANRHLERHGHDARIDHRSLPEQGIDREAGVHLGHAAHQMEMRGARSDRGDELRNVEERNDLRSELRSLDGELLELTREEEAARRRGRPSLPDGLEWTQKGGMVEQQASALRAVMDRSRSRSDEEEVSGKRLRFFGEGDRTPETDRDGPGNKDDRQLKFFDERKSASDRREEPSKDGQKGLKFFDERGSISDRSEARPDGNEKRLKFFDERRPDKDKDKDRDR